MPLRSRLKKQTGTSWVSSLLASAKNLPTYNSELLPALKPNQSLDIPQSSFWCRSRNINSIIFFIVPVTASGLMILRQQMPGLISLFERNISGASMMIFLTTQVTRQNRFGWELTDRHSLLVHDKSRPHLRLSPNGCEDVVSLLSADNPNPGISLTASFTAFPTSSVKRQPRFSYAPRSTETILIINIRNLSNTLRRR